MRKDKNYKVNPNFALESNLIKIKVSQLISQP